MSTGIFAVTLQSKNFKPYKISAKYKQKTNSKFKFVPKAIEFNSNFV